MDADFCRNGLTQITQFQSLLSAEAMHCQAQPKEYYTVSTSLPDEPKPAPSGTSAEETPGGEGAATVETLPSQPAPHRRSSSALALSRSIEASLNSAHTLRDEFSSCRISVTSFSVPSRDQV